MTYLTVCLFFVLIGTHYWLYRRGRDREARKWQEEMGRARDEMSRQVKKYISKSDDLEAELQTRRDTVYNANSLSDVVGILDSARGVHRINDPSTAEDNST